MTELPERARHTALLVRAQRRITKTRRTRMPRQQYPKLIEGEYARAIIGRIATSRAVIREITPQLRQLVEAAQRERSDSATRNDAGESDRLRALLESARKHIEAGSQLTEIEQLARLFAERTSRFQRVQLGRQLRGALGADVFASDRRIPVLVDHFVAENVALIKTIPLDQLGRVEKLATRAFTDGTTVDDFTAQIDAGFHISERHARLIARDQIGKLNGQTNAYRQQDLGIRRFQWDTAGDERVRDEHERLNGQIFDWDDPPSEGFPGEPIQCRCSASPVLDEILDAAQE